MDGQVMLNPDGGYAELERFLKDSGARRIFLVCGGSIRFLKLDKFFKELPVRSGINVTRFSEFTPNPDMVSVMKGVQAFQETGCDYIAAVGGGSAIDVAKCVRLYGRMDATRDISEQQLAPNPAGLLAVPTTSGSGSEATRFAVVYRGGVKQSVTDDKCRPDAVLLDFSLLKPLPELHRKCTMLDALCHSVESFWSVNATDQSRGWATQALRLLLTHKEAYLQNEDYGNQAMQRAAFLAGKAIDITQTTAGHAMAYGLTTRYGLPHGLATAMCMSKVWPFMLEHTDKCIMPGGQTALSQSLRGLAAAMDCESKEDSARRFKELLDGLELPHPKAQEPDIRGLVKSVDPQRLSNNPVALDNRDIEKLYREILF